MTPPTPSKPTPGSEGMSECEACKAMDLPDGTCHPDLHVDDTVWCAHHSGSTITDCHAHKDARISSLEKERDAAVGLVTRWVSMYEDAPPGSDDPASNLKLRAESRRLLDSLKSAKPEGADDNCVFERNGEVCNRNRRFHQYAEGSLRFLPPHTFQPFVKSGGAVAKRLRQVDKYQPRPATKKGGGEL